MTCAHCLTPKQRLQREIDMEYWRGRFLRGLPSNKKDLYMNDRRLNAAIRVISRGKP